MHLNTHILFFHDNLQPENAGFDVRGDLKVGVHLCPYLKPPLSLPLNNNKL